MHDFNEALHSQHYVSSPRTTSRTDNHQAGAICLFLWLLCPITLLTYPFGVKAPFEGRSISSSVAETSEITARNIHFLSPPPEEGLDLVTNRKGAIQLALATTSVS